MKVAMMQHATHTVAMIGIRHCQQQHAVYHWQQHNHRTQTASAATARTTPRIIQAACASAGGGLGLSGRRKIRTRAVGSSPPEPRRKAASEDDVLLLLPMECSMP